VVGIVLIVIGMLMSVLAYLRFRQVEKQLSHGLYRSDFLLTLLLTACILFVGVLMLVYLL
jgi:putative membrane protein